jgi:4-phytase / acid phosphatase
MVYALAPRLNSPSLELPHSHSPLAARRCRLPAGGATLPGALRWLIGLWLIVLGLGQVAAAAPALDEERASPIPTGRLVKVVILSRHGVRSPIPSQSELDSWTASQWPIWHCPTKENPNKVCASGQLTPRGATLAQQMGTYYRSYLAELLRPDQCPAQDDVFFWADLDERTRDTGEALLGGFRPNCDVTKYFHTAEPPAPDRIFHPVTSAGRCTLNAARAEAEIHSRTGGNPATFISRHGLEYELAIAQKTLQCCQPRLCQTAWDKTCRRPPPPPNTCTLTNNVPSCVVAHPETGPATRVLLGGALRVASTFAELLLLEYANGFPQGAVGWGRITRAELSQVFRLHTMAFDLEQRTPYIAKRQGSMLLKKILLALQGTTDNKPGTAPPGARLVAYVGHDTNISNVARLVVAAAGLSEEPDPSRGRVDLRASADRRWEPQRARILCRAISRRHAQCHRDVPAADSGAHTALRKRACLHG